MREKWEFPYTADKILEGARVKAKHHLERWDWWGKKRAEVMDTIRSSGIDFDESLADPKISNSYNRQPTVQIDHGLMRDLQECTEKVREHKHKTEAYEAWMEVLTSQKQQVFPLTHDDWLFFFGENKVKGDDA